MTGQQNQAFVARPWVQSRIRDWVASPNPVFVLTGPPGSGKSALVRRLAGIGIRPAAVHLCRGPLLSTTEPVPVLASLATALARRVSGYAEALIDGQPRSWRTRAAQMDVDGATLAGWAVLDSPDPFTAYERGFRYPLAKLAASGELRRDVLVVIDGLDEVSLSGRGNELADLFALGHRAAPRLRVIVTARIGLIADRLRMTANLNLDDDPSTIDTIATAMASSSLQSAVRRTIAAAAGGNYVFAMLAARTADLTRRLPAGLDDLYRSVIDDGDEATVELLGLVCQGRDTGLSPSALAAILDVERPVVAAALAKHQPVLDGSRFVRPHHRCLADFVKPSLPAADGRIATYLIDQWGGRWARCTDAYALRNVLPHLADAAFHASTGDRATRHDGAASMLRETLSDPAFVTAALSAVGVDELRAAITYTRHRIAGTSGDVDTLPMLADILHAEAPLLRERRTGPSVTRQLVYQAATIGATDLARGLPLCGAPGEAETLWATDDNIVLRKTRQVIRGHRAAVTAVTIAANGTRAVSASLDGATLVWRVASGRLTRTLPTAGRVAVVHSAPDAEDVRAAYSDGTTQAWDLTTGSGQRVMGAPVVQVTAFAVANDGSRAVTGDLDHGVTVWDLTFMAEPLRFAHDAGRVTAVAISADGRHVAAAGDTGQVTVWDAVTARMRVRFHHLRGVTALCLTPQGDRIVIGDAVSASVRAVADPSVGVDTGSPPDDPAVGLLLTRAPVTALAANPGMSSDFIVGTAAGQIVYIRVP